MSTEAGSRKSATAGPPSRAPRDPGLSVSSLEKLQALGVKAMLFTAKPGKKPNTWLSEVLAPRCQLSEYAKICADRMKDLYGVLVRGESFVFGFQLCGHKPEYLERTHADTGRTCKLHTERSRRI
ncbi:hypothetical protein N1851_028431 [Merluccius polli]|uniref:Uncharacterized protein n=1 Tax=Merluccius polli TaxID=89951 RepID=A0AA47M924_MERPO|nr:hypothetical protein N1851_028431 [Merluccius polli]